MFVDLEENNLNSFSLKASYYRSESLFELAGEIPLRLSALPPLKKGEIFQKTAD